MCSLKPIKAHYTNYVISKDYTDQVDGLWNEFVVKKMLGMDLSARIPNSIKMENIMTHQGHSKWHMQIASNSYPDDANLSTLTPTPYQDFNHFLRRCLLYTRTVVLALQCHTPPQ